MKCFIEPIRFLACATLMALSLSSMALQAGEWHSAGNAPPRPHFPSTVANYACELTLYTSAGIKTYRIDPTHEFRDADFRPPADGGAAFVIANEADPGMNGQGISLHFAPNAEHGEDVILTIRATLAGNAKGTDGKVTATSVYRRPRFEGEIRGEAVLYDDRVERGPGGPANWVHISAVCTSFEPKN